MKKHHIYLQIIAFVFACTIMQGCQKEDETEGRVTLNAVVSDDYGHHAGSKTHIIDKCVYWDNGDFVNINGTRFDLSVATNESVTTATIDSVPVNANGYVAVYPAGFVTTPGSVAPNSENVGITIPSILYMKPGHIQNTQGLMVATMAYGGTSLSFHNAGAVLALDVTNGFTNEADLKLYRIKVASSTSGLSGSGTLSIDGSVPSYSISSSGTTLTLDMENDTITYNETKTYCIPIPPQTQDGGTQFTVTIYATNGDNHYVFTRNSNSGLTVQRNKQVPVSVELSAANVDYTINTINGGFGLMGSGTEADPYVIATLKDLNYFKSQVSGGITYSGKYIRQTADIDASVSGTVDWTPIGTSSSNCFQGTYDGGGHTTTLKMKPTANDYGFFKYLNGAAVKNLTLDGTCESDGGTYYNKIGGFCGEVTGGTCSFTNCTNKINLDGLNNVAGFVGNVPNTTGINIQITQCKNSGDITAHGASANQGVAGFIGHADNTVTIDKCKNSGTISASNSNIYMGGFLGYSSGAINITNSVNIGALSGTCASMAGFVAWSRGTANINNCYTRNTMSGSQSYGAAGIVGRHDETVYININNCYGYINSSVSGSYSIASARKNYSYLKLYNCYRYNGGPSYTNSDNSVSKYRLRMFNSEGGFVNGQGNTQSVGVAVVNGTSANGTGSYSSLLVAMSQWVILAANSSYGFSDWKDSNSDGIPELAWE